jgi:hypothetical protein
LSLDSGRELRNTASLVGLAASGVNAQRVAIWSERTGWRQNQQKSNEPKAGSRRQKTEVCPVFRRAA